jgi:hypothetical protein
MAKCPDCGVKAGEKHKPGCDVENCARCGRQTISCNCIYEVCGMDVHTMETEHPDIYRNGPTDEMYEKWDREWGARAIRWSGEWPGLAACREFNLWTKWTDHGWEVCAKDHPDAREDLNTLMEETAWDPETQRRVKRSS